MIHSLDLKNFVVHRDARFDFYPGLNTIVGPNASGKSTIMEAIRFALHGTSALRGKADDIKGARVSLKFAVKGTDYQVNRTTKDATLLDTTNGTTLAVGTRPVNNRIAELFGYGLAVFDVANCANQGDIEALSAMRSAERKRLVDTTLGLAVIDTLAKWCGDEATAAERECAAIMRSLPTVNDLPPRPEGDVADLEARLAAGREVEKQVLKHEAVLATPNPDPGPPPLPPAELKGKLEHAKFLRDRVANAKTAWARYEQLHKERSVADHTRVEARAKLDASPVDTCTALQDTALCELYLNNKAFIESHPAPKVSREELTAQRARHHNVQQWKDWERHKRECPACSHQWSTAGEPPGERLPDPTMTEKEIQRAEAEWVAFEKVEPQIAEATQILLYLRTNHPSWLWTGLQSVTRELVRIAREQEAAHAICVKLADEMNKLNATSPQTVQCLQSELTTLEADIAAFNAWAPRRELHLRLAMQQDEARAALAELTPQRVDVDTLASNLLALKDWLRAAEAHAKAVAIVAEGEARAKVLADRGEAMRAVRDALGTVKTRVKAHIAPSLSRVASGLVARLSAGLRSSVQVDPDFELWVDQQPVDTLSGSEKAAANLALRIALGQVLTARVFPVFLADEPDAAMDAVRAEAVAAVLPTVAKQVILVTHKDSHAADNTIRLG